MTIVLNKIPGFVLDSHGKPIIELDSASLYAYGHLIRATEQLILNLFSKGLLSGTTHTCLGQELCQMAVVRALTDPNDVVLSNHRNHGHFLTYSGKFVQLVAEILGRKDGVCGGRGGSQHLAYRHFHSNGVQGGMTGIGAGLGLARALDGTNGIVAVMIGDGTLGEGMLYESMNLASIWQVPVLFVVENNRIAQTTDTRGTIGGQILDRGAAFGLATKQLDDSAADFFEQTELFVESVRDSRRPGFLVIDTMRMGPHSKGDDLRSKEEIEGILQRDPLTNLGNSLPDGEKQRIESRNKTFVQQVEQAALASPEAYFEQTPEHIFVHTGKPEFRFKDVHDGSNVRGVLNKALHYLLETSGRTIVLGEDLHDPYGGAFKVTAGLSSAFPGRVISTPISEAGVTGAAIGLAMAGFKPIMEVMFADFLTLCMDQIYNHAVKFPGVFPDIEVPLVIRSPAGGRRGYGPTHSQSPENILASVPGLTLVYGSHRHDVGQLLINAVNNWQYPVVFLEHKLLYGEIQSRGDYEVLPAEESDIAADLFPTLIRRCVEPDVTLLTYGGMLPEVEKVAAYLEEEEEISVDVLVPSLLSPFPKHLVFAQLAKCPRLVIIEEAHHSFGVGAEILAGLAEAGFKGRTVRVGTPPVPIASARSLERQILPGQETVIENILKMF